MYTTYNTEILNKFMEYLACDLSEDLDFDKFRIIKCTIMNVKFEGI
jgi:hypothetical protein